LSTVSVLKALMTSSGSKSESAFSERTIGMDAAFSDFVAERSAKLLRSAYLLTGDRGLAEDLLQVVLVRTARRWDSARRAPEAYAHRVLINLLHDDRRRLRARPREQPLTGFDDALCQTVDHADTVIDRLVLIRAVKRLPVRQREVVVLRFFTDLSVAETARAMGSSEGSVKTHTSRALAHLRQLIGEDPDMTTIAEKEVPSAD
jgi:RNA polymerase sigma-70 factor (sigma-E family)